MSLINEVLRDLDRRQASESERAAVPNEVRPLPEPRPPLAINRGLLAALALTLCGYVIWESYPWHSGTSGPVPGPSMVVPDPAKTPPIAVPPAPTLASVADASPIRASGPAAPDMVSEISGGLKLSIALSLPATVNAAPEQAAAIPVPAPSVAPAKAPPLPPRTTTVNASSPPTSVPTVAAIAPSVPSAKPVPAAPNVSAPVADDWSKAQTLLRGGTPSEAEPLLRRVIDAQPEAVAPRQALIAHLLATRRYTEAMPILKAGLARHPSQTAWAMNLARLHAEGGDYVNAWDALSAGLPHAQQQAEYLAFAGTVLQRIDRPGEAAAQYQAALRLRPDESRWWVGLGLAFEASGRQGDARGAYQRAKAIGGYSSEMARFIDQKLQ